LTLNFSGAAVVAWGSSLQLAWQQTRVLVPLPLRMSPEPGSNTNCATQQTTISFDHLWLVWAQLSGKDKTSQKQKQCSSKTLRWPRKKKLNNQP